VARIRAGCKRFDLQIDFDMSIESDDVTVVEPMLYELMFKVKIKDGNKEPDEAALKAQVAQMMNSSRPGLYEKFSKLQDASFIYDKPAKEGRDTMTLRELLEAVVESEKFFRPLTHFGKGIDTHRRFLEAISMVTTPINVVRS
jgi:hypothetical protein